jgi:hypothetical protein
MAKVILKAIFDFFKLYLLSLAINFMVAIHQTRFFQIPINHHFTPTKSPSAAYTNE